MDNVVQLTAPDAPTPRGVTVERSGQLLDQALDQAASHSGFERDQLQGAVITRESSSDAFRYDPSTDEWIAETGTVVETVVVDSSAPGVLLRIQTFQGSLIRRVAVVSVETLR
jgi:hypothetical protein